MRDDIVGDQESDPGSDIPLGGDHHPYHAPPLRYPHGRTAETGLDPVAYSLHALDLIGIGSTVDYLPVGEDGLVLTDREPRHLEPPALEVVGRQQTYRMGTGGRIGVEFQYRYIALILLTYWNPLDDLGSDLSTVLPIGVHKEGEV